MVSIIFLFLSALLILENSDAKTVLLQYCKKHFSQLFHSPFMRLVNNDCVKQGSLLISKLEFFMKADFRGLGFL